MLLDVYTDMLLDVYTAMLLNLNPNMLLNVCPNMDAHKSVYIMVLLSLICILQKLCSLRNGCHGKITIL